MTTPDTPCRCRECATIHADFIAHFNKWPTMSHTEAQALQARRNANLASWTRLDTPNRERLERARTEAAARNTARFGTDPSWYDR